MIFKVGDRVSFLGVKGKLSECRGDPDYPFLFKADIGTSGFFLCTEDGKVLKGQTKPSFKLLVKKKKPRTFTEMLNEYDLEQISKYYKFDLKTKDKPREFWLYKRIGEYSRIDGIGFKGQLDIYKNDPSYEEIHVKEILE